jgi:acyl-CoA synthetase (AMP-forming)/AMP-acid ligase II
MNNILLQDFLSFAARETPNKIALICGATQLSYQQIDEQTNALANTLVAQGLQQGDRALVFMDNSAEAVISFWAILKANGVVSMVNPQTKAAKLAHYIKDSGAHTVITQASLFGTLSSALKFIKWPVTVFANQPVEREKSVEVIKPDILFNLNDCLLTKPSIQLARLSTATSLAAIVYTSGSSGAAKGVMLSHSNMTFSAEAISTYLAHQSSDVILSALPLSFDYGLYQMILTFHSGAQLILEKSFTMLPKIIEKLRTLKVTGFPCLPTVSALLATFPDTWVKPVPTLRYITSTGANLNRLHIQTLQKFFPQSAIFSMYGLTECKRCSYLDPIKLEDKPNSVGGPIPGTELWLVDDSGNKLAPGESGELVIKGPHIMAGYWNNPEATAKVLKADFIGGGLLLYTGDHCYMDIDGDLYFISRKDDIIKSRGEKVSLLEVEKALLNIQGIKDAAVVAITDAILGQACKAFIVLEQSETLLEKELRKILRDDLEASLMPKELVFIDALPLNPHGKIDKNMLSSLS